MSNDVRDTTRTCWLLTTIRAADFNLANLFVRVSPDNLPAIHCYESAGFTRVSMAEQAGYNAGQPHRYVWLRWAASVDESSQSRSE